MRARGGERSFGTWLSGLVGSASASSGGGGTDEPRTAVCDDEIDDRWVEDGRPPPEATAPARTKAKPRHSSPTPPRERSRSPWYRRGEGAKVIRPAKSGAPEVGARAAWPSLAVLPPWFRRWRRPIAQRPGAAAAYEEALLAEPERPHWLWTPSPEPTTPPEPLSTTEKHLRQGNLPDSQANGPAPAGFDTAPALSRREVDSAPLGIFLLEPKLETPNRLRMSSGLTAALLARGGPLLPPPSERCQTGCSSHQPGAKQ